MIEILLIGLLFKLQLAHGQQSNFLSDFQKTNGSPFFLFFRSKQSNYFLLILTLI